MTHPENDSARDLAAIAQLIAHYNFVTDKNDFVGWAECFTADGVFNGEYDSFSARAEVDRFASEAHKIMKTIPNLRHFVTNILTEVEGTLRIRSASS
jgi:hypothetical protein